MIIRCTKCSTEFALDPSQVGPEGVTLRCSVCSHMFHAEPDPEVTPAPWRINSGARPMSLPDLRRVLEQVEDGRLRPEDQLSHTGQTWIRLGEMPEFSTLFIGHEGLPRVFKAIEAAPAAPETQTTAEDRREETVRVRMSPAPGRGAHTDLPGPPDFGALGIDVGHMRPEAPTRHMTQEFVSRASTSDSSLPAPPDFGRPEPTQGGVPRSATASGTHRALGQNPLLGGPIAAESGTLPALPALPAPPDFGRTDTRPRKPPPASMLEAVTKVVVGAEDEDTSSDAPGSEANRTRSAPILVADLARAAAAHTEKTVQAVDSQRAREKAELSARTGVSEPSRAEPRSSDSSSTGRAATAAAVTAAMAIARETAPLRSSTSRTERTPIEPSPRVTEKFPAEPRPTGLDRAAAVVDRSADRSGSDRTTSDRTTSDHTTSDRATSDRATSDRTTSDRSDRSSGPIARSTDRSGPISTRSSDRTTDRSEPARVDPPRPEPSVVAVTAEPQAPPRPPEVVIVKVAEPAKSGSGAVVALLGVLAAAAVVFGVPSIRERVFNLGQPTPVTKAEPTKAAAPAMPTEEFKQARAALRSLGLKETNKAQTGLQKIADDPKRPPAAVAEARHLLAELLLTRALACQIAVALDPSAMGGEAQARSSEDPPAARDLLAALQDTAPLEADAHGRITALQAIVAGQSPAIPPGNDELSAVVRAAPLWRGQIKTPPSGLITSLQRLPTPSTLSQSVLALALVRSGDDTGAREILLEILTSVPDQPVARTLLDVLDRQGMMNEQGDPEVIDSGDPPSILKPTPEPRASEPGKKTATGVAPSSEIEAMISAGCQQVRAGDPEGVKVLLDAIQRGAKPTANFNLSFCLGNGFARQNSHDTAFTWYSRAVAQSPQNRDALAGAARSAELLGRTSVAVDYYKRLRALEPGNAAAGAYLSKHDQAEEPQVPPPDDPGELMPVKPRR